jgi:hypothetical protein
LRLAPIALCWSAEVTDDVLLLPAPQHAADELLVPEARPLLPELPALLVPLPVQRPPPRVCQAEGIRLTRPGQKRTD